ncbi:hypothetical protein NDU88_009447 [Pleurodeles waltl]|uniref:Uncharacterized protein n=1 Tax=Pleurodeles waltl TaxID=8319 RepID=A0AAV7P0R2_PLEWA|nr:hypothetical protein NDU88_009447 [Pleurodeles waltl]
MRRRSFSSSGGFAGGSAPLFRKVMWFPLKHLLPALPRNKGGCPWLRPGPAVHRLCSQIPLAVHEASLRLCTKHQSGCARSSRRTESRQNRGALGYRDGATETQRKGS